MGLSEQLAAFKAEFARIAPILFAPAILRRAARLPRAAWGEGLVFALLRGVPFVLLDALGLKLTSAAEAAAIAPTLMPVFAGLFAWAFLPHRQRRSRCFGYAAIVAGFLAGAAVHGAPNLEGVAALAAAAAMWAVYTTRSTPIRAAALICIWSAVFFGSRSRSQPRSPSRSSTRAC
jgi:drug/metabolite transporter (DMT)-like permease